MSLSRQERQRLQDDKFGPVTLHWRVTSMWGPSPQPANPPEETFASNADALARVSVLIKTEHFHNPFITDSSGNTIWTESELRQKCT
jgi:hypothetical protein